MKARAFWKSVTVDEANLLDQLVSLLEHEGVSYCVIGGQGGQCLRRASGQPRPRPGRGRRPTGPRRIPAKGTVSGRSICAQRERVAPGLGPPRADPARSALWHLRRSGIGSRCPWHTVASGAAGRCAAGKKSGPRRTRRAGAASDKRTSPILRGSSSAFLSSAAACPPPSSIDSSDCSRSRTARRASRTRSS